MAETPETAAEIQTIRFELEAIRATQMLLMQDRVESLLDRYLRVFDEDPALRDVYLEIDGVRTQGAIVEAWAARGTGHSQPTTSRRMAKLRQLGLIEIVPTSDRGEVYEKNRMAEAILQLSVHLRARQ